MPDRFPLLREVALALFLVVVALGLWLARVSAVVVIAVMALALAIAWTIEWLRWREIRARTSQALGDETQATEEAAHLEEPRAPPLEESGAAPTSDTTRAKRSWSPFKRFAPADVGDEPATGAELAAPASVIEGQARVVAAEPPHEEPASELASGRAAAGAERSTPSITPSDTAPNAEQRPALRAVPSSDGDAEPRVDIDTRVDTEARLDTETSVDAEGAAGETSGVVRFVSRTPRTWNLWELERLAREEFAGEALEQSQYLFLHLRRFARADGQLPVEFDELVRDSFGGLLDRAMQA